MKVSMSQIQNIIANDLESLEFLIEDKIAPQSMLGQQITGYINNNHGKRLRSMVLFHTARMLGYSPNQYNDHLNLACIIEMIHTATLLHDDVIDNASIRRNNKAAHLKWGNKASILAGDFLLARSFQVLTELQSPDLYELFAHTTADMVQAELLHLENNSNIQLTSTNYLNIMGMKTAKLFSVASQLGGLLNNVSPETIDVIMEFGHHLGMIFQIKDDIMDYTESSASMGKNKGQDFAERKPTLPLIVAYQKASNESKKKLEKMFKDPTATFDDAMQMIDETNAISHCLDQAYTASELARDCLKFCPKNIHQQALDDMITFALERNH